MAMRSSLHTHRGAVQWTGSAAPVQHLVSRPRPTRTVAVCPSRPVQRRSSPASAETTHSQAVPAPAPAAGTLQEINQGDYYSFIESQGDKLVLIDFYTEWCGPCKVINPELIKLQAERADLVIAKLNCNKSNKELGVQLKVRVAPTFFLYHRGVKVAEMTGAKVEALIAMLDKAAAAVAEAGAAGATAPA